MPPSHYRIRGSTTEPFLSSHQTERLEALWGYPSFNLAISLPLDMQAELERVSPGALYEIVDWGIPPKELCDTAPGGVGAQNLDVSKDSQDGYE